MAWEAFLDGLAADLDVQFDAARAADLAAQVAERTRGEAAALLLVDRVRAATGRPVRVGLAGGRVLGGRAARAGADWLLLHEPVGVETLLALPAVLWIAGLGADAAAPATGAVAARLDLRHALRGVVRDRSALELLLVDGSQLHGTVDRVGRDFLEVAEYPAGEQRRAAAVSGVRLVPLAAVAGARRRG